MPQKRKLFLTHASELAHNLVRTLLRDGLVAQFIRSYADRYGRKKLVANPEDFHLVESTVGREALLVTAVEIRRLLPRAFASGRGALRPEENTVMEAFYAEFLASLGRSLEWRRDEIESEAQEFHRDLEIYRKWTKRAASPAQEFARVSAGESPFPDRCAILLDPAIMEQARRAAVEFEGEVVRTSAHMFAQLGRGAMRPARKPPQRHVQRRATASPKRRSKSSPRRAPSSRPLSSRGSSRRGSSTRTSAARANRSSSPRKASPSKSAKRAHKVPARKASPPRETNPPQTLTSVDPWSAKPWSNLDPTLTNR